VSHVFSLPPKRCALFLSPPAMIFWRPLNPEDGWGKF
jgi:hypothetical protein